MSVYIRAWNKHSQGAKLLSEQMGAKLIKHQNSRFVGGHNKIVINWGCSELTDQIMQCNILNYPDNVEIASNKLNAFVQLRETGVNIPRFTTSRGTATAWLGEGYTVLARTVLNGHSGNGIVIMENPEDSVPAPLYTQYVKKRHEYRIHVMRTDRINSNSYAVIDAQRKGLSSEFANVNPDEINWKIRNLANGFVYVRNDDGHRIPESVFTQAIFAVRALRLDFGAVDVIWNERNQIPYVLEVNTAPGITGTTVTNYANAFNTLIQGIR